MKRFLQDRKSVGREVFCFLLLFGVLLCGLSCSGKKPPAPVRAKAVFRTEPAGASIFIAGRTLNRVTPAEYTISPGVYVVKFTCPGYQPQWKRAEFKKGTVVTVDASLVPLRASLLVAAKADGKYGVQVYYKDKLMGETPLVLRDLPVGKGEVLLSKKGYASRRESFTVTDSLPPPPVVTELSSNRGDFFVSSLPAGAEVRINGEVAGHTPFRMQPEEGRYKLELRRSGYRVHTQEFDVVRGQTTKIADVKLVPLPAKLFVKTSPRGAKVFINGEPRGEAAGTAFELPPGEYVVRAEKSGFNEVSEKIVLGGGEVKRLTLTLDTVMGALEIVTRPAGVAVFVDGKLIGRSKPDPANPKLSEVMRIPNIRQGEHSVTISHKRAKWPRGGSQTVSVNVVKGKTARVDRIELWVPDVKILLKDGRVEEGRFLYYHPDKSIHYQPRPGMGVTVRKELIRDVEKLPVEDE